MADPSPEIIFEKNRLTHPKPWLWLLQIKVPTLDPGEMLRITPNPVEIEWETTSSGVPLKWSPFPLAIGEIHSDSQGGTPEMTVSVGNMTREIMAVLVVNDYLMGQAVVLRLVHEDHLALGEDGIGGRFDFLITAVDANEEVATFTLSGQNPYNFTIPNERVLKDFCRFAYKGLECGYSGDPGNVILGPCGKTYEECILRGLQELLDGGTKQHPARFGGFKGTLLQ